MEEKKMGMK